ncbi:MAG: PorT family protein [Chitinophagales bacterium]|nr:PorT family protein [Chitinophagales bacterium]
MKKLTLTFLAIITASLIYAQGFEFGIHGAYSSTWLLNQNVNDQGENLNPVSTFAPLFGISAKYTVAKSIGIMAELNLASVDQKYDGSVTGVSYAVTTKTNWIDIPVLIVLRSTGGFYFELGPQFSFLSGAQETFTSTPPDPIFNYSDKDFKNNFKNSQVAGVFGFGGDIPVSDYFRVVAGLRFTYALTDAINKLSETELITEALNGELSLPATYAHLDQLQNYHYERTTILTGGFHLGVVYVLNGKAKEN